MLEGSLEDNVITMLVWDDKHASGLTLLLKAELFSTKTYRKIAEAAINYIQAYSKPPGIHLRDLFEDDLRRGDDGTLLGRVLDAMDALRADLQPDYVLSELSRFIALRKLALAVDEASDALHAGDLEGAERAIYQREPSQPVTSGIWLHDAEAMLRFMDQREEDFFSSGIEVLDQRGVRPQRKELMLLLAPKKSGKSWWVIAAGCANIMHKKSVLHVTLENSEEVSAKRYIQALYALTRGKAETVRTPIFLKDALNRFTSMDFSVRTAEGVTTEKRGEITRKLRGLSRRSKLLIKEFPTGGLTIAALTSYLDQLERAENFKPDLIIVDSVNKMTLRGEHLRTDLGQAAIGLRQIAVARNCAVLTTTHTNRGGDMTRLVTGATHVGEDYSLLGTADIVCTISRTKAERAMGLARILVDAARNVDDQWITMISQSLATGQFCLDSVYMSKHLEEEVNRFSGVDNEDADC